MTPLVLSIPTSHMHFLCTIWLLLILRGSGNVCCRTVGGYEVLQFARAYKNVSGAQGNAPNRVKFNEVSCQVWSSDDTAG